jgi:hypothetical protein
MRPKSADERAADTGERCFKHDGSARPNPSMFGRIDLSARERYLSSLAGRVCCARCVCFPVYDRAVRPCFRSKGLFT